MSTPLPPNALADLQAALAARDLARANSLAPALAAAGQLGIVELFGAAQLMAENNRRDYAIALYRTWLVGTPSPLAYAACFNLAVLLSDTGDAAAAETAYRTALSQNPQFSEAWLNLGTLLERQNRPDEALDSWRKILEYTRPEVPAERSLHMQALNNLGRLLEIRKDYPAAEDMLTRSLKIDPDQINVITHWVHLRQKQCKWPVYSSSASGIPEEKLMLATSALAMLSASGDPAQQLAASQRFVDEKVNKNVPKLTGPSGYGHKRLRVGYLSSDFCSHAVSILTAELYGLHDRNRVEVYGFDWSREDGSPLRARVIAGMDQHIRIHTLTDEQAARLIRSHEIDILVDLHGLTLGARPDILAYRPAPVQITWLGLPGPTALPEVDYVIADPFVLPPELEPYFTEKPLHMPRTFQINDRQRQIGPMPTRAACGLPQDAFVFCAFNNNFKINPEIFGAWMNILKRVPDSVLWMVADNEQVRTNLARQAELAGVDKSRLLYAARVVPAEYLARYQVADLFLDTIPFNGGTTASDALWAGLPVLTCAGKTFSSRMAGSLLRAVDLPELVTFNLKDYEEKAVELGLNRQRVDAMKQQLVDKRMSCALFDSAQFVRDLEDRYEEVALKVVPGKQSETPVSAAVAQTPARHIVKDGLPLVSVLIPTHNRPDYCELAVQSVLAQTWPNIEIVISDNSDDELTRERLAPYIERHSCIHYMRVPGYTATENGRNCFNHANGEFINFLMDDDLFHPEKLSRMMSVMFSQPNIGLVTSFRQLIDAEGRFMAPIAGTEQLFQTDTLIGGTSLGDMMLTNGSNMIGEPTTVLFRKAAIGARFGDFMDKEYVVLSDVATWLSALSHHDAVYLPEALSYFRIHGGQDQARGNVIRIRANVEWLQLLCDAHENGKFMRNREAIRDMLTNKLVTMIWYLSSMHEEIKAGAYVELEKIHSVIRQATGILLGK